MKKQLLTLILLPATLLSTATSQAGKPEGYAAHTSREITSETIQQTPSRARLPEVTSTLRLNDRTSIQTLESAGWFKFRRMTGSPTSMAAKRVQRLPASESYTFFESFEDAKVNEQGIGDYGWLPQGWTRKSAGGLADGYSWFGCVADKSLPPAADGSHYMAIMYQSTIQQDEWLITPAITPGADEELSFHAYMDPTAFFGFEISDTDIIMTDELNYTFQVYVSDDGGEQWTMLHDYAEDFRGMQLEELMNYYYENNLGDAMARYSLSLGAYAGKEIKIAFRYYGCYGATMTLDAVAVAKLPLSASYTAPQGQLYWTPNTDFLVFSVSNELYPVNTPLTWTNTTEADGASFSWTYHNQDGTPVTATTRDLTATYAPDYTTELTKRNNIRVTPTLSAEATGRIPGTFQSGNLFQCGGAPEYEDEEGLTHYTVGVANPYGAASSSSLDIGIHIIDNSATDAQPVPVFGYSADTDDYWSNRTFGNDAADGKKAWVEAVMNYFPAPAAPLVIDGISMLAMGRTGTNVTFTARLFLLDENGKPADKPSATASCNSRDINAIDNGGTDFLGLEFIFDTPFVADNAFAVEVSGFHNAEISFFAPFQTMEPADICHGWLRIRQTTAGGDTLDSILPISDTAGEYGPMMNAFYIDLLAYYPWLDAEQTDITAGLAAYTEEISLGSYHDGSEYTITADTADGKLPEWLTAEVKGRYDEATLLLHLAEGDEARATITLTAPGISKDFNISRKTGAVNDIDASPETTATVIATYTVDGRLAGNDAPSGIYIEILSDGSAQKKIKR